MPIFVSFTPACDRQGCGAIEERSKELGSFSRAVECGTPPGWGERNGEILCSDCFAASEDE